MARDRDVIIIIIIIIIIILGVPPAPGPSPAKPHHHQHLLEGPQKKRAQAICRHQSWWISHWKKSNPKSSHWEKIPQVITHVSHTHPLFYDENYDLPIEKTYENCMFQSELSLSEGLSPGLTEIHLGGDGLEDKPLLPSVRQGELNLSLEQPPGLRHRKTLRKKHGRTWKKTNKSIQWSGKLLKLPSRGHMIRFQTHLFAPTYIQFEGRSRKRR